MLRNRVTLQCIFFLIVLLSHWLNEGQERWHSSREWQESLSSGLEEGQRTMTLSAQRERMYKHLTTQLFSTLIQSSFPPIHCQYQPHFTWMLWTRSLKAPSGWIWVLSEGSSWKAGSLFVRLSWRKITTELLSKQFDQMRQISCAQVSSPSGQVQVTSVPLQMLQVSDRWLLNRKPC